MAWKGDVTVYGLRDPRTGRIRYVGRTAHLLEERLDRHMRGVAQRGADSRAWFRELKAAGLRPTIESLAVVNVLIARDAERAWVDRLVDEGEDLVNRHQRTGEAVYVPTTGIREWAVSIDGSTAMEIDAEVLVDELIAYHASASARAGKIGVTMTVTAPGPDFALSRAARILRHSVPDLAIDAAEVLTTEEQERRVELPVFMESMTEPKRSRMPDLELNAEARSSLREILARPHHPSSAIDNVGRQRTALRDARQRETAGD